MKNGILHFFAILLSLLLIDSIYLWATGEKFLAMIRQIQAAQVEFRKWPAVVCYLLLSLAILYFIETPRRHLGYAFLLGIIIYGVYESTSYALLKKWDLQIAVIDTVWGGILLVLATILSRFLMKWVSRFAK